MARWHVADFWIIRISLLGKADGTSYVFENGSASSHNGAACAELRGYEEEWKWAELTLQHNLWCCGAMGGGSTVEMWFSMCASITVSTPWELIRNVERWPCPALLNWKWVYVEVLSIDVLEEQAFLGDSGAGPSLKTLAIGLGLRIVCFLRWNIVIYK